MPDKGEYDRDVKARAIRLVREHAGDYPTEWVAVTARRPASPLAEGGRRLFDISTGRFS